MMVRRLIQMIACLFIMLIAGEVAGQKKSQYFQIPGRVKMDKGESTGAVVNVINLESKQIVNSLTVTSLGKFDLLLNYQTEYKLSVSKEGYYTKDILISTLIPPHIWEKDSVFPPFYIVVTLFKKVTDAPLSFIGKTIGKVSYSPNGTLDNFDSQIYIDDKDIREEIDITSKSLGDGEFNQKLAAALAFEKNNELKSAYLAYIEASKLKPNDKFVKDKIKDLASDLKDLLNDLKIEAEYNRLMASGDLNIKNEKYPGAIENFKGALTLKPNDVIAKDKLAAAEQLLAQANAGKAKIEEEFLKLLADGDDNVSKQLYPEAITNFTGALTLKPGDSRAVAKLAAAQKLLAKLNGDKTKLEQEFNRLMAEGDKNVKDQKYPGAIDNFKGALTLKPNDVIAKDKLASAEKLLAKVNTDKAKLEEDFKILLASGDDNVSKQLYPEAVGNYNNALNLKPGNAVALAKLATAEKLLAKSNADKAKLENEFNRLLAAGDRNVKDQKYPEAIDNFKGALNIKPNDLTAKDRLAAAEQLLAKVNADKSRIEEDFDRFLASGDDNISKQIYPEAVGNYNNALNLKPGNAVALAKLATAEKLLAKSNADKAKLENEFNRLLAAGDRNVKDQKYPEAIDNFKGALYIKPNDLTAKDRLAAAEQLLAKVNADKSRIEQEFNKLLASGDDNTIKQRYPEAIGNYNGALKLRPGDAVALSKLAAAEKLLAKSDADKAILEDEFKRLIAEGDKNVTEKKYPEGIENFKGALNLKPNDLTAKDKLSSAVQLLAKFNEDKARAEEQFKRLLASGDENVKVEKYVEALGDYKGALQLKSENEIVIAKIADVQKKIQQKQQAADLASMREQEVKQKQIYDESIKNGDLNFKLKKWTESLTAFTTAVQNIPDDSYAKGKVLEVKNIIGREEELTRSYQEALLHGVNYFNAQQYNESLTAYKEARRLKPEESLPQQKIKEIQSILDDLAAKELIAQKQAEAKRLSANDNKYLENIRNGDENYQKSQWSVSRFYFIEALKIKPDDAYALGKVDACDKMANANITTEKMQEYKNRISKGDEENNLKNYSSARFYYRNALEILPWESYPQGKLKEIDQVFAVRLTQADQLMFKENLNKADDAFAKKEYPIARFYYNKANEINQVEYVSSKLKEIEGIVSGSETKRINAEYDDCIKKADEAFQQKSLSIARFYYQKASSLKPGESYSKDQLKKLSPEN